ncbi:MAG TPA: hypothetical protein VKP64_05930 [Mycobacteriales bacterium]|nr:hypothetical protein [Mycobacteriales bacterium]
MTSPPCPRWCATGPHDDPTTPHYSGTLASAELDDGAGSMLMSAMLVQEPSAGFPELRVELHGAVAVSMTTEQLHRAASEVLNLGLYLTVLGDRLDVAQLVGA